MSKPHIIMTGTMLDELDLPIDAEFEVHRASQQPDPATFLKSVSDDIIGIAHTGGGLKMSAETIEALPNLRIIANFGVGYDSIDVRSAAARNIVVTNTPDVLTEEVADTALGLLLMTVRELGAAEQWLRAGKWTGVGNYPLTPLTLRGRKVGIVGLGRIGLAIAKRCEAFGLTVAYHSRSQKPAVPYAYFSDVVAMAEAVDTLIIITPGTPETQNMIDARVLRALGSNGVLINIARGSVVDETALKQALRDRVIFAAGLDVMWNEPHIDPELMTLPHCVLLPHVGSASVATRIGMGQLVIDNLVAYKTRSMPLTPVPETPFNGW
ncbi:MAG: 2-hydroxyacid dehydrogenase [Hyphomicrobiaceae bacterium]